MAIHIESIRPGRCHPERPREGSGESEQVIDFRDPSRCTARDDIDSERLETYSYTRSLSAYQPDGYSEALRIRYLTLGEFHGSHSRYWPDRACGDGAEPG